MKKFLILNFSFLIALMAMVGCTKKPAAQKAPADENRYINITALTPEGTELSLSDLVGQTDYVLVDFWASWCGPCRRFVPVLKEIYASQPEGHLQILSCSVDQDIMAWQVALQEEQMPWPQMREDETHLCADKYDVQFIPHTVLINSEGNIVGVNLDEAQIEQILFAK